MLPVIYDIPSIIRDVMYIHNAYIVRLTGLVAVGIKFRLDLVRVIQSFECHV